METDVSNKTKWGMFGLSIPIMIWTLIPIVWILATSLKKPADLSNPDKALFGNFWPKEPTLDNYRLIFTGGARYGMTRPTLVSNRPI